MSYFNKNVLCKINLLNNLDFTSVQFTIVTLTFTISNTTLYYLRKLFSAWVFYHGIIMSCDIYDNASKGYNGLYLRYSILLYPLKIRHHSVGF